MDYKRILAVGDIHGMYDKLIALIEQVQFSPVEDLLIFLGDYIDRGPKSLECLDYVMNLQQQYPERVDRKSTRLNSSHPTTSRMPSSA